MNRTVKKVLVLLVLMLLVAVSLVGIAILMRRLEHRDKEIIICIKFIIYLGICYLC
jgi:uncharacterized membrane protein YhaH (DUF805 family)